MIIGWILESFLILCNDITMALSCNFNQITWSSCLQLARAFGAFEIIVFLIVIMVD